VEGAPIPTVNYLIFELADGDVRWFLDSSDAADVAWKLRSLHDIATALMQLHGQGIAHQDLKPSNVLVFSDASSRVGDLGRGIKRGQPAPHEQMIIAGHHAYAPPELHYGSVAQDWQRYRLGCDLYQLGSMALFLFESVTATPAIFGALAQEYQPTAWSGPYQDVLPHLRDAFNRVFAAPLFSDLPSIGDKLLQTVRQLCDPDPSLRGHPRTRAQPGNPLGLERFVTAFDLMSKRAEIALTRQMRA